MGHQDVTFPRPPEEILRKSNIEREEKSNMRKIIKESVKANIKGESGKKNKIDSNYVVNKSKRSKKN